MNTDKEKE